MVRGNILMMKPFADINETSFVRRESERVAIFNTSISYHLN